MLLQLAFVLIAIVIGIRIGGIGLGVLGDLGFGILTFGFGLQSTSPPIDVMLMIVTVIAAASCMQAAGGPDLMIKWTEKLLRKNPQRIAILSPLVTYLFTFTTGAGHMAYSVPPIIAEAAMETKIRPEHPMAIAVIASQQATTASPISAATVVLLNMLSGYSISLMNVLMTSAPCTLLDVLVGTIYPLKVGKELDQDPKYSERVANHESNVKHYEAKGVENQMKAALSISISVLTTITIVIFGSMKSLYPVFTVGTEKVSVQISHIIEVLMLTASASILLFTKTDGVKVAQSSAFSAGTQAVVAIFGITWTGDTFIAGDMTELKGLIEHIVTRIPWLLESAPFVTSTLLFSQTTTIRALLPLGIVLETSSYILIALFPAVDGYLSVPNYPTVIAAINFNRTGTARIGRYILNHSFMMPGLIATGVPVGLGLLFTQSIQ